MITKFFNFLFFVNFMTCSISSINNNSTKENLIHIKKDNSLYNELYGIKQERFLRDNDLDRDELIED